MTKHAKLQVGVQWAITLGIALYVLGHIVGSGNPGSAPWGLIAGSLVITLPVTIYQIGKHFGRKEAA